MKKCWTLSRMVAVLFYQIKLQQNPVAEIIGIQYILYSHHSDKIYAYNFRCCCVLVFDKIRRQPNEKLFNIFPFCLSKLNFTLKKSVKIRNLPKERASYCYMPSVNFRAAMRYKLIHPGPFIGIGSAQVVSLCTCMNQRASSRHTT